MTLSRKQIKCRFKSFSLDIYLLRCLGVRKNDDEKEQHQLIKHFFPIRVCLCVWVFFPLLAASQIRHASFLLKSAFDNGDKMTAKRHVTMLIFLLKWFYKSSLKVFMTQKIFLLIWKYFQNTEAWSFSFSNIFSF